MPGARHPRRVPAARRATDATGASRLRPLLRHQARQVDELCDLRDGGAVCDQVGAVLHPQHLLRRPAQRALHEDALDPVTVRGDQHLTYVTVLEDFEDIATVRVLSAAFMDYLHVGLFGGRWLIVNVLWQDRSAH